MGLIRVCIRLRATKTGPAITTRALVDTGASLTVIPKDLASRLKLHTIGSFKVELANGRKENMTAASAVIGVNGHEAPTTVLISPRGEALLGAESMELLGIIVDPKRRRLKYSSGFSIKAA
jgi:clan AA aspartic protease